MDNILFAYPTPFNPQKGGVLILWLLILSLQIKNGYLQCYFSRKSGMDILWVH